MPLSKSDDLKARVREALARTPIMALSTVGPDGPWTSPVEYHLNDALELSFLSQHDTEHGRNIEGDPRVSVAIYSFPGPPGGNIGLQIRGIAERVSDQPAGGGWIQYKITPHELWCFDSRVYGGHRQLVDLSSLRIDADR